MNNKNFRRILSGVLSALMFAPALVRGDQGTTSQFQMEDNRAPYVGEAAIATVGRVFGVEGDASTIQYHEYEFTQHSPRNSALRSLIVPGWGQHFNGQRVKGTLFFLCTAGALWGSLHLYDQAHDTHDAYEARGVKNDSLYDDYKNERSRAMMLGGAAAVLWAVGVWDAHKHAYSSLYSKNPQVEWVLLPVGAGVWIKKSF